MKINREEQEKLANAILCRMACVNITSGISRYDHELSGVLHTLDLLNIEYIIVYDGIRYAGIKIDGVLYTISGHRKQADLVSILECRVSFSDMEWLKEYWHAFYENPEKYSNCADMIKSALQERQEV